MQGKKKCTAWKNQFKTTLTPKYQGLVKGSSVLNEMAVSEVVATAVRCYFDKMPENDRIRLIKASNHYPT